MEMSIERLYSPKSLWQQEEKNKKACRLSPQRLMEAHLKFPRQQWTRWWSITRKEFRRKNCNCCFNFVLQIILIADNISFTVFVAECKVAFDTLERNHIKLNLIKLSYLQSPLSYLTDRVLCPENAQTDIVDSENWQWPWNYTEMPPSKWRFRWSKFMFKKRCSGWQSELLKQSASNRST